MSANMTGSNKTITSDTSANTAKMQLEEGKR